MKTYVPTLDDLTVAPPPFSPADWNDDGVVILPGFFMRGGDEVLTKYAQEWEREHVPHQGIYGVKPAHPPRGWDQAEKGGWADATPYMRYPALRRLVCDGALAIVIERLLGEVAGVHLNLTGWVTTERDWHQDTYLNPPHVGDYYAAVWIALADIEPDSGPFQFIPGSHRWPTVTQLRIGQYLDINDPHWPKQSERILTPLFEAEIEKRNAEVVSYLPKRGDVLLWHGRLLHRGSKANVPGTIRPALIAHYSGVHHRHDMPRAVRHDAGGWYFPIGGKQPVR